MRLSFVESLSPVIVSGHLSCIIHLDLGCTFLTSYNVFNTRNCMFFALQVVFNDVETLFTILNVAPAMCSDCNALERDG